MDVIDKIKAAAREGWSTFAPFESITGTAAPALVRFANITTGDRVLDVGCGTGVVALTAARRGAHATGVDLTPELIERAKQNAALAEIDIDFSEGDVEDLKFEDASFDVVVSQFGHMFGPRADRSLSEMLRVLAPGGTIAFSTWPPDVFTGRLFKLVGKYSPPPPPGIDAPVSWGDPQIIEQRFGEAVRDITFDRARMYFPCLSPAHMRVFMESNVGPGATLTRDDRRPTRDRRGVPRRVLAIDCDLFSRQPRATGFFDDPRGKTLDMNQGHVLFSRGATAMDAAQLKRALARQAVAHDIPLAHL